jgi:hypothetical protein
MDVLQCDTFFFHCLQFGQVGCGNTEDQTSPQLVKTLVDQKITLVVCGWRHTVAITERGNVYSWGRGTSGQLGHGDAVDCHTPKRIEILSVDGQACRHLEGSQSANPASSKWISPAERYAVVPDETLGSIAPQLHQVTHVDITQLPISFLLPQTPNNTLPFYQSFVFISLKGFF